MAAGVAVSACGPACARAQVPSNSGALQRTAAHCGALRRTAHSRRARRHAPCMGPTFCDQYRLLVMSPKPPALLGLPLPGVGVRPCMPFGKRADQLWYG